MANYRKLNILILIYILFIGCASKVAVNIKEDQQQLEIIEESSDLIENIESYENDLNQLIDFEIIAKTIKDAKDRIEFYQYVVVYFYEKTSQLKDKYTRKKLFLDVYSDQRLQQKYVSKIINNKDIYNNRALAMLDFSEQSTIDRAIVKSFFNEAKFKRDEYKFLL